MERDPRRRSSAIEASRKAVRKLPAFGALLAVPLFAACEVTLDVERRVQEMVEAHNARDVETQLALFAEHARILLPDRSVIEGKEDIRQLLEWDASLQHRYEFLDLAVSGDTVLVGSGHEESEWFTGTGIGRVEHEPGTTIVFLDGLIAELRFAPLVARDLSRTRQVVGDFARWAAEARPDLLETLMPGNRFVYSEDAALTWLEALRVWHEERPPAY
jgi:hypothetical protein